MIDAVQHAPDALLVYGGKDTFWMDPRVLATPWDRVICVRRAARR